MLPYLGCLTYQFFSLHNLHVGKRRRAGNGVSPPGTTMLEGFSKAPFELISYFCFSNSGGNGQVATAQPFGYSHYVRNNSVMLTGKPFSGTAKTTDDFVHYHENTVFVAYRPNHRPVFGRRRNDAWCTGNSFSNDCRHCFRVLELKLMLNSLGTEYTTVGV